MKLWGRGSGGPSPAVASAPSTYAQWTVALDRLAAGDDDARCLLALRDGRLEWTPGVAPLFVQRLGDEIQRRLQACSDRLTRDLRQGSDESSVVRAMLQARHQLAFVDQLCRLPVLPRDVQAQLCAEVQRFARSSQSSLLDSARADRSGRLASLIEHNALTRYDSSTDAASVPAPAQAAAPGARRILF